MNGKQYNNVIDWSLTHDESVQSEDSLNTARVIFKNMGVALPEGDLAQVAETLKTDDYMGWRSCTMQEAQVAANNGVPTIGISEERIVVLSADDEEELVAENAAVMTLSENTSAYSVSDLQYYAYTFDTPTILPEVTPDYHNWEYYANLIIEHAKSFLGMTESEVEEQTGFDLSDDNWCVDFVRLCCKLAGVYDTDYTEIIPTASSSTTMLNKFKNDYPGICHEGTDGIQAGDIAFFASSATSTTPYHVAIATSGVKSNGRVDTINGNWGRETPLVRMQQMPTSNPADGIIKWYAHPDYEKANNR